VTKYIGLLYVCLHCVHSSALSLEREQQLVSENIGTVHVGYVSGERVIYMQIPIGVCIYKKELSPVLTAN